MISVVIPSFKNPRYLNLCLRSALDNQVDTNEIIVVLDGPCEESVALIRANYASRINVCEFAENRGQQLAHNTGVTLANRERILIVNDDNVFPPRWDERLNRVYMPKRLITPNQIEPNPSMFPSFHIVDFGKTPEDFQFDAYAAYANDVWERGEKTPMGVFGEDGQTWPVFMEKTWYMAMNGIDERFPSPAVADWDFFLRAELMGLDCCRLKNVCFYHFAGAATKRTPEAAAQHAAKEAASFDYFAWKWGYSPMRPPHTNSAFPPQAVVNGVRFRS